MSKSILDRSFRYVPARSTDLRKTFARVIREQKEEQRKLIERSKVVGEIRTRKQGAQT